MIGCKVAAGFLACLLMACSVEPAPPEPAGAGSRRVGYHAIPEWDRSFRYHNPDTYMPGAIAAGYSVAVVHLRAPCVRLTMLLRDPQDVLVSHPCDAMFGAHPLTGMNRRSDAVGAHRQGVAWHLSAQTGALVSETVGGTLALLGRLPASGPVLAACSSNERFISYADSLAPGVVRIHDLLAPEARRELALPAEFLREGAGSWAAVQLGGAPGEPCVLVAPRAGLFAVIEGDTAVWTAPFHEPLPHGPPRSSWARLMDWFHGPLPPPPPGPLDATSFNGGVAVLFAGATAEAGRLVDLYDRGGRYTQTMILPEPAVRIASTGTQLLTLCHRDKRWRIAAYWFPGDTIDRERIDSILPPRLDGFRTVPSPGPVSPP